MGGGLATCYLHVNTDDLSKRQYSQWEKIENNPSVYIQTSASCNQLPPTTQRRRRTICKTACRHITIEVKSLCLFKVLNPPFHSFEARTWSPFKQRGLHPATLQGRTRARRMGPGRPTCTFTQTHTELSVLLTYTICCAKHLES